MPFVPVPRDLTKVKTKLALGLTKRQLICFSIAAAVGLPVYFLTRSAIGNSAAMLLMIGLMLPAFFMAMYEKDGQPAEKVLRNMLRHRWYLPITRPYRTENIYAYLHKEGKAYANKAAAPTGKAAGRRKSKRKTNQGRPESNARQKAAH
jgi:hypothetical protein